MDYRHTIRDRRLQTELAFTLAKNATKPNPFETIPLQTTRKENNWKIEEVLARAAVNSGDGTDQRVQSLMFMMMMMMIMNMEVVLRDIVHLYYRYRSVPSPWFHFDTELARTLRVYKCVVSIPLWGSASV